MDKRRAAVVGAVNLDICGRSFAPLVPHDSNPGAVSTSLGGVGRNIAHNLALLGVETALVTALGEDAGAQQVRASCQALGVDLSGALTVPGGATSTYLVLADHQGEMALAVSDMDIYQRLTPDYLAHQLPMLNAAGAVVLDANLPAAAIEFLAKNCAAPLFADPVSTAKAVKLEPVLGRLHTLKANRLEAQTLSGVDITDDQSLHTAAGALLARGVDQVFISLGPDGLLACDRTQTLCLPNFPGEMKNATGCGDALTAALVWGFLQGLSLEETARAGLAAASVALAGADTINPAMSAQAVKQLANL